MELFPDFESNTELSGSRILILNMAPVLYLVVMTFTVTAGSGLCAFFFPLVKMLWKTHITKKKKKMHSSLRNTDVSLLSGCVE